jgi:LPS-assembly lipoprotein
MRGSERSFTSYSATSTTVATIFAQRDARRRLMVIIADRILQDIVLRADGL